MVGVAQLVEHQVVALVAVGSNPITHPFIDKPSPSSSGLGHRPFTAKARVRLPLGTLFILLYYSALENFKLLLCLYRSFIPDIIGELLQ